MKSSPKPTPETWLQIIASAYELFDDAVAKGFGDPPFSLGGGTVLMLRFKHRLSKDIDLFGYDAQWLSVFSPRLNDRAAMLAASYTEQSNTIKIVTASGDIDFIIAADVAAPVTRTVECIAGRLIEVDPVSEILAKQLFYRAATFKVRDILVRRLDQLRGVASQDLVSEIIAYEDVLQHSQAMVEKVRSFVMAQRDEEPGAPAMRSSPSRRRKREFDP